MPETPTLEGNHNADICVIGLGGSGITAVHEAACRGFKVIGIDASQMAAGAAGRNGGFLLAGIADFHHNACNSHGEKAATEMYFHTIEEIDRMEATTPEAIQRKGTLRIAHDAAEFQDCMVHKEALQRQGFPVEDYDGEQGKGILLPSDGVFQPQLRIAQLAKQAMDNGAQLFTNTPALHIASGSVATPNGRITAKTIIVAVDGNLAGVLPEVRRDVREARFQMISTFPVGLNDQSSMPGSSNPLRLKHAVYTRGGYDYWQQLSDGRILIGGGRDKGGEAEWTSDPTPTAEVSRFLESRLEELGVPRPVQIEHRWAAIVSFTRNGLPFVKQVKEGVWGLGAYCGTGNVVGALLGRAIVEQTLTGRSVALKAFQS
jgi:gamma-glutamylputrescine oxidase